MAKQEKAITEMVYERHKKEDGFDSVLKFY